jgi:hypothetical protein
MRTLFFILLAALGLASCDSATGVDGEGRLTGQLGEFGSWNGNAQFGSDLSTLFLASTGRGGARLTILFPRFGFGPGEYDVAHRAWLVIPGEAEAAGAESGTLRVISISADGSTVRGRVELLLKRSNGSYLRFSGGQFVAVTYATPEL